MFNDIADGAGAFFSAVGNVLTDVGSSIVSFGNDDGNCHKTGAYGVSMQPLSSCLSLRFHLLVVLIV